MITAQEIQKIITDSMWGEYDSYHEWSPQYSLQDKANMLEKMLADWDQTEPAGQKLILEFIQNLILEAPYNATPITEKIVLFANVQEIAKAILRFLNHGIFCKDLLTSMKDHQIKQDIWLTKIKELVAGKKLTLSKNFPLKPKDLYWKVGVLVQSIT